ncbi:MAG: rhodanese-like domain-containing protein [Burkholderiales bacterium]|nr:MAG: rhodanese-like domain-containing protein [Burkholderiales bacterium]
MSQLDDLLAIARKRGAEMGLPYFGALTPREAAALLQESPDARMIDVRTNAEWDWVGHIPGIPLIEWQAYPDMHLNERFIAEVQSAVPDRQAPLLFVCRSGARSDLAARAATAAGYECCFNVLEGFEGNRDEHGHRSTLGGWRAAGLPWEQN